MRTAIGLALSGREVRLAMLGNYKGDISVLALDTIFLDNSLEYEIPSLENVEADPMAESKDVFGLKDLKEEKSQRGPDTEKVDSNLEILYKFLYKYLSKKTRIGLNIPVSMAQYQRLDRVQETDGSGPAWEADRYKDHSVQQHLLKTADGATLALTHDQYPPFLTLLQEVNDFLGKKLFFGTMDSTELAVASLARASEYVRDDKTTAIVYVEDDFTRLIFLQGRELLHISSIINENAASPQILDIIYRRLLYEIDQAKIADLDNVLLAGRCARIFAKKFFAEKFPDAYIAYLHTHALGSLPVEEEKQKERFSEFAVAIALAWKQLEPKRDLFFPHNFIPRDLRDQQEILKLDRYGYALLAITGLLAFFITFQIIGLRNETRRTSMENKRLKTEIERERTAVNQVLNLEDERMKLHSNLVLADSLAKKHNAFLLFLKKLNTSVQFTGNVWIDEVSKTGEEYSVRGAATSRLNIPVLADRLGGAMLDRVTREGAGNQRLYRFSMNGITFPNKDEEIDSGIIRLANFTTVKNFARDLFTGNYRLRPPMLHSRLNRNESTGATKTGRSASGQTFTSQRTNLDRVDRAATAAANGHTLPERVSPAAGAAQSRENHDNPNPKNRPAYAAGFAESRENRVTNVTPGGRQPLKQNTTPPPHKSSTTRGVAAAEAGGGKVQNSKSTNMQQLSAQKPTNGHRSASLATASTPAANNGHSPMNSQTYANGKLAGSGRAEKSAPLSSTSRDRSREASSQVAHNGSPANRRSVRQPVDERRYFIEVATTYDRALAEKYATACRQKGLNASIAVYYDRARQRRLYRVLIGNYPSRQNAEKAHRLLTAALGPEAMQNTRIIAIEKAASN